MIPYDETDSDFSTTYLISVLPKNNRLPVVVPEFMKELKNRIITI